MYILHLINAGGIMMYPLIFCSIAVIAIFIERVKYYKKSESNIAYLIKNIEESGNIKGNKTLKFILEKDGGVPAKIILEGINSTNRASSQEKIIESAAIHAIGKLKEYITYLDVIVTLSPLMGLLGTVVGMIGSFNVLSVVSGQPFAVTSGVAEALVCTATGLGVAIMALLAYTYLTACVNKLILDIEKISTVYLTMIEGESE